MIQQRAERIEAAKQAVAVKDWSTARRILAPMVAEDPNGVAGFYLARTELELGRPEIASPLVSAFRARRPRHLGSAVLAARIHLAAGDLAQAEKMARTVLELEPGNEVAPRLLERIQAAAAAKEAAGLIAIVDARHREARTGVPSQDLLDAANALRGVEPGPDWVNDSSQAKIAYFHHSRDVAEALRSYDPHLIEIATRFDYLTWPRRIQQHLGGSVLDVGCGSGGVGIGYLVAGAASYTGVDPALDLDSTRARNKRLRGWDDMGVTARQIAEAVPAVELIDGPVEAQSFDRTFDTIVLHNVSEHLPDLEGVLAGLTSACHPGTKLVLLHHNFYSWNGHNRQPYRPGQFDERNAEHRQLVDWRHTESERDDNLNRLRLDELRTTIESHFVVTEWEEALSDDATRARLTPAILERVRGVVPDISERDLVVNNVFCTAGPRPDPGGTG